MCLKLHGNVQYLSVSSCKHSLTLTRRLIFVHSVSKRAFLSSTGSCTKLTLKCMIGSPTLFLILSCAEYDSLDISTYRYPIQKLCTVDPVFVSRKFSQKFHYFLEIVILKGQALSPVAYKNITPVELHTAGARCSGSR